LGRGGPDWQDTVSPATDRVLLHRTPDDGVGLFFAPTYVVIDRSRGSWQPYRNETHHLLAGHPLERISTIAFQVAALVKGNAVPNVD
jgi:hypothetical protein